METSKSQNNGWYFRMEFPFNENILFQDIFMVQLCLLMFPNSQFFDSDQEIDPRCQNWFEDAVKVCSRKLLHPHDNNLWKSIMKLFQTESSLLNSNPQMFLDPALLSVEDCRYILTNIVDNYVQIIPRVPSLRDEISYLYSIYITVMNIVLIVFFVLIFKSIKRPSKLSRLGKKTIKNFQKMANKAGRFNLGRTMCETTLFQVQSSQNPDVILETAKILTTKITRKRLLNTMAASIRSNDGSGDERNQLRGKLHEFLSTSSKCCVILSFELEESLEDEEDAKEIKEIPKLKLTSPPKMLSQIYPRPRFTSRESGDSPADPPTKKKCFATSSRCSAEYDSTSIVSDGSALSIASTNSKRAANFRLKNSGTRTPTSIFSKDGQSPRSTCLPLSQASTNRSSKIGTLKPKPNLFVTKKYKDS